MRGSTVEPGVVFLVYCVLQLTRDQGSHMRIKRNAVGIRSAGIHLQVERRPLSSPGFERKNRLLHVPLGYRLVAWLPASSPTPPARSRRTLPGRWPLPVAPRSRTGQTPSPRSLNRATCPLFRVRCFLALLICTQGNKVDRGGVASLHKYRNPTNDESVSAQSPHERGLRWTGKEAIAH